MRAVAVMSSGRIVARLTTPNEVDHYLAAPNAIPIYVKGRLHRISLAPVALDAEDKRAKGIGPNSLRLQYRERIGTRPDPMPMLKRLNADGVTFEEWHPSDRFNHLRGGSSNAMEAPMVGVGGATHKGRARFNADRLQSKKGSPLRPPMSGESERSKEANGIPAA